MPGGHIFHRDLSWPFAETDEEVGRWGVETEHPNIWLCGAGARRGGGVSGIPGHNAARAVLAAARPRLSAERLEHGPSSCDDVAAHPHRRPPRRRGRALCDDGDLAAGRQRQLGQPGHRVDLERGPDAEHQIGAAASSWARSIAATGRYSPNRTTSGLSGRPHSQRGTPAGSSSCRPAMSSSG